MVVRDQQAILVPVLVATAGNTLGAFTTYWLGRKAADIADERKVVTPCAARGGSSSKVRAAGGVLFLGAGHRRRAGGRGGRNGDAVSHVRGLGRRRQGGALRLAGARRS